MKILTWYIAKTYLKYWVICLLALVSLVVAANLFGNIDNLFTSQEKFLAFLHGTIRSLPTILDISLPITVLLAVMFTFNSLGRTSELVAMRSVGMGLTRQLKPILVILLFISAFDYYNQNYLFRLLDAKGVHGRVQGTHHLWQTQRDRIIYLSRVDSVKRRLFGINIFQWKDDPFRLVGVERIQRMNRPDNRQWVLEDVVSRRISDQGWQLRRDNRLERSAEDFPEVFQQDALNAHHMPIVDLYRKIRQLKSRGERVELYELEWYQKTAALFAPFALVWFGTPLSQTYFRRGRASGEIMLGILGCLLFLIATEIFFMLGKGGFLHPAISTWAVNIAFVALGCVMMLRAR